MKVIIGSYTANIGLLSVEENKHGSIDYKLAQLAAHPNPSWLAWDAQEELLFAVSELPERGLLYSYKLRTKSSRAYQLEFCDLANTGGGYPCYISLAARQLVVTNYMGGPVSLFHYNSKGELSLQKQHFHRGELGRQKDRQEMSHPHSSIFSARHRGFYISDLGFDQIYFYTFTEAKVATSQASLRLEEEPVFKLPSGYGPRHFCFSRDHKILYVLCELQARLLSLALGQSAQLQLLGDVSVLSKPAVPNFCSELCLHPYLPYIYLANRGTGTISILRIASKGQVQLESEFVLPGPCPRHIALDPSGRYLFAALQNSSQIQILKVDQRQGTLQELVLIPYQNPSYIGFI